MPKPGIDLDRIDPQYLTELAEPIEALYTALEHDLMVNIAKRFKGIRVPKSRTPWGTAWRAYMLARVGGLTDENMRIIAGYTGDISEATREAVKTSVLNAIGVVDPELQKSVTAPDYVPSPEEVAEQITDMYMNQALNRQNLVNTVMLNSSLDWYRKTVNESSEAYEKDLAAAQGTLNAQTGAVIHGAKTFGEALRDSISEMAEHGLTGFHDRAGREWSAQAYVTMDMRTTTANAAREAVYRRNEDYGNNLISVSSHAGARPLCFPYQGGVYSTDGSYGTTTELNGSGVDYYPLEDTSYGEPAGLFGINCGHFPSPFLPGLSPLRRLNISQEENDRLYKESQEQRYMERKVRAEKTKADALEAAGDKQGAKAARAKAREKNAELRAWCDEKGRAYYPERVRVVRAEKKDNFGTINSGAYTGAKKTSGWQERHAERYYEEVRNRKPYVDASKIAKYTDDFTADQIEDIRQHMFIRIQPLDNGTVFARFDPDFDQAQAWQRLTEGRGTKTDLIMLHHEYLELTEMRKHGYNYDEAHAIANERYNWWRAVQDQLKGGE